VFGAHVWRRDPPCARRHNKEYLLNSPRTIESSIPAFHGIREMRGEQWMLSTSTSAKAFDTVSHKILLGKLRKCRLNEWSVKWIEN